MSWDWLAVGLNLLGCFLNARRNIVCWPILTSASVAWILHWWPRKEWASVFLMVVFIGLNAYGWVHWHRQNTHNKLLKGKV